MSFDTLDSPPARRTYVRRNPSLTPPIDGTPNLAVVEDTGVIEVAPAPAVIVAAEPGVAPAAVKPPKSRDIGNWQFTPWKGHDMWTNIYSGSTSFTAAEVKKRRRDR